MKLGTCMVLGATGLATLGLAASLSIQGCSSSSGGGGGTSGGAGTVPPARPSGPATTSTDEHNFALYSVALGDGPKGTEWQAYGYNIDGQITDSSYQNVCNPAAGGQKSKLVDGPGGIDNSFGKNIINLIEPLVQNLSATVSTSIQQGKFTIMLDTKGLSSDASQTATGLTGQIFGGVHFDQGPNATGSAPTFTTADNWPLSADFLPNASDPTTSKIKFDNAYVVNGTFVNGDPTSVDLQMTISGVALVVPIKHASLTFAHQGGTAANGIIAGVINTAEFINNLRGVAGNISNSLCSGSAFDQIAASITAASDIMDDGTAGAGSTCNAISIGIGFTAKEIGKPQVIGQPATGTDACNTSDAGTGGGTDSGGGGGDDGGGGQDAASE